MGLNRENYIKKISDGLGTLTYTIKARNISSLYDINICAEGFFAKFLNLAYGYNLMNLNILDRNMAAIDLGDEILEIAIQVTSDNTSTKIKKPLRNSLKKGCMKNIEHCCF